MLTGEGDSTRAGWGISETEAGKGVDFSVERGLINGGKPNID